MSQNEASTANEDAPAAQRKEAMESMLKDLAHIQPGWEFIIYRTAKTVADLELLKHSTRVNIAKTYLHNLTKL